MIRHGVLEWWSNGNLFVSLTKEKENNTRDEQLKYPFEIRHLSEEEGGCEYECPCDSDYCRIIGEKRSTSIILNTTDNFARPSVLKHIKLTRICGNRGLANCDLNKIEEKF